MYLIGRCMGACLHQFWVDTVVSTTTQQAHNEYNPQLINTLQYNTKHTHNYTNIKTLKRIKLKWIRTRFGIKPPGVGNAKDTDSLGGGDE